MLSQMCPVFMISKSSFDLSLSWLNLLPDHYNLCRLLSGSLSIVKVTQGPFASVWKVKRLNLIPLLFIAWFSLLNLICDLTIHSVRLVENFPSFWSKTWKLTASQLTSWFQEHLLCFWLLLVSWFLHIFFLTLCVSVNDCFYLLLSEFS